MLILSYTGVLVVGVTSVARERGRERVRERVPACVRLCLSRLPCVPVVPVISTCVHVSQRISLSVVVCLRKALDIPFYRYKEMPSCTMGV
jgi:hypothetical protein